MTHHSGEDDSAPGGCAGGGGRSQFAEPVDQQRRNGPNQSRNQSPRSLQCQRAWDAYRVERLPPDNPRRKPTLPRLSILDDKVAPNPNAAKPKLSLKWRRP